MSSKNIIDDIAEVLENHRETSKFAYVSQSHAREFFAPRTKFQPESAPQPVIQRPGNSGFQSPPPRPGEHRRPQFTGMPTAPAPQPQAPVQSAPMADFSSCNLDQLKQISDSCTVCPLCQGRTNGVFGAGNPNADLMFIGEGPGQDEDMQGIPFVGKAGMLLTKMINAMQFSRDDVYICNIVKCRPPNNRNPLPEEAAACRPYLERQIELVKPKVMVLLGAVPLQYILDMRGIMRLHGQWFDYKGIKVMPTFHPAYLLRYPEGKRDAWDDLQKVMKVFGKVHTKR